MDERLLASDDDAAAVADTQPGDVVPTLRGSSSSADEDVAAKRQRLLSSIAQADPVQIQMLLQAQEAFLGRFVTSTEHLLRRSVEVQKETTDSANEKLIGAVLGKKKISQAAYNKLKAKVKDLEQKVLKILNVSGKLERVNENLETLSKGQWPKKLKPFSLRVEVRQHADEAPAHLRAFSFQADEGSSICEVLKSLHAHTTIFMKKIDKHLYEQQIEELKPLIKREQFVNACLTPAAVGRQNLEAFGAKLGIDLSACGPAAHDEEVTSTVANGLFDKLMASLADQDAATKKKRDHEKQLVEDRVKKLAELQPKELLEKSIEAVIKKVGGRGKGKQEPVDYPRAFAQMANTGMMDPAECVAINDDSANSFSGIRGRSRGKAGGRGNYKSQGKEQSGGGLAATANGAAKARAKPKAEPRRDQAGNANPGPVAGNGQGTGRGQGNGKTGAKGKGKGKAPAKGKGKENAWQPFNHLSTQNGKSGGKGGKKGKHYGR